MIRPATLSDVPVLTDLGLSQLAELYPQLRQDGQRLTETIRGLIVNPEALVLVAGDPIHGMIGMLLSDHPLTGERIAAEIAWFMRPETRGSRTALRLLTAAEAWAQTRGADRIYLMTPPQQAESVYTRRGYRLLELTYEKSVAPLGALDVAARTLAETADHLRGTVPAETVSTDADPPIVVVWDDVLADPDTYRAEALSQRFRTVDIGGVAFHGLAEVPHDVLAALLTARLEGLRPGLTFFRQSPEGQQEPNYIHTDRDMGDWTAILYLTPTPDPEDGTTFWRHRPTQGMQSRSDTPESFAAEWIAWRNREVWEPWQTVRAAYNRLVWFQSAAFHSRAIEANYGTGTAARLTQVMFGRYPEGDVCRSAPPR